MSPAKKEISSEKIIECIKGIHNSEKAMILKSEVVSVAEHCHPCLLEDTNLALIVWESDRHALRPFFRPFMYVKLVRILKKRKWQSHGIYVFDELYFIVLHSYFHIFNLTCSPNKFL